MDKIHRVQTQINMINDLGYDVESKSMIMDLGCGNGDVVMEYRRNGWQAFGCDFTFKDGENVQKLKDEGVIVNICNNPYRLPFEDNTFDVVVSDQVFEHVKDYPSTISEISRILKPGGLACTFSHLDIPLLSHICLFHVRR